LLLAIANVIVFGPLLLLWLLVMLLIRVWWIPLYYDSISYAIEDDAVRGQSGVFWKRYVTVPFVKITNINITQGPLQRVYDIGTIHIQTAGAGGNQGFTRSYDWWDSRARDSQGDNPREDQNL